MGAAVFSALFIPITFGLFIMWDSGLFGKIYKFVVYKCKQFM